MSDSKAPYYYKEGSQSDAFHWKTGCSKNHYPSSGWKKVSSYEKIPFNKRDQCKECQDTNIS